MIVTLIIPDELIQEHQERLLLRKSVSVSNFQVLQKTNYDRGDCDHTLLLKQSSKIESIPHACKEYNFVLGTTIKQLAKNAKIFATRTIGTILIVAQKIGQQYTLHVKYGNIDSDKATVNLSHWTFFFIHNLFPFLFLLKMTKITFFLCYATTSII